MGRRTGDAMTRVRNGNEDAAVAQNEQGTKHCGPVASGLLVMAYHTSEKINSSYSYLFPSYPQNKRNKM